MWFYDKGRARSCARALSRSRRCWWVLRVGPCLSCMALVVGMVDGL